MKLFITLAATLAFATASPYRQQPRAQLCNGNADFCNRKYSNVSLIGAHNSAFVGSTEDLRVNQQKTVTEQLDAGIRFLQSQVHVLLDTSDIGKTKRSSQQPERREIGGITDFIYLAKRGLGDFFSGIADSVSDAYDDAKGALIGGVIIVLGELSMCHTECALLYAGRVEDYLVTVKKWLDAHPDEVISMILANGDNRPVTEFDTVFKASGIDKYAFVPSTSPNKLLMDQWPTYGELISSGKRLIMFLDYEADESKVPYILDQFTYFFETPFSTTDPKFPQCDINRLTGITADGRMYLVNHSLNKEILPNVIVPDHDADYTTNAATGEGSIGAQADLCISKYARAPNAILVDMFDRGDVFTAQNTLNGV